MRIPSRGEIWFVNLDPRIGREQQGIRPALVISEKQFNALGLCVVCPITQGGQQTRFAGFAVPLMGSGSETQGIVMCNQPRTIDMNARGGRFVENVSDIVIDDAMSRLQTLFEDKV